MAVDHLVVVAHAEHVQRGRGQQPDQQHVGRGQVLELVHQQVAVPGLLGPAERTVPQQQLDGQQHLLVEVDDPAPGQLGAVGGERLGQAGHVAPIVLHVERVAQAQAHRGQRVDVGRQRVGVEPAGAPGHQGLQQPADVAHLQHLGPPAQARGDDLVAEGVEREDAAAHARGAGHHLVAGLAVVGDRHHRGRLVAPVEDQVAHALGQHPGLARARGGDDPGRTGAVGDRGQLVGCQVGRGRPLGRDRRQPPGLDRLGVHQRHAVEGDRRAPRGPPSTQAGEPSGSSDVARRLALGGLDRAQAGGLAPPPPDRARLRRGRRRCWPRPGSAAGRARG